MPWPKIFGGGEEEPTASPSPSPSEESNIDNIEEAIEEEKAKEQETVPSNPFPSHYDETVVSTSPVYGKPQTEVIYYSFGDALLRLKDQGGRITKKEWGTEDEYGTFEGGILHIYRNGRHVWQISDGDLIGDDYYFLSDSN